jgi:hypothetical protein
VGLFEAVFVFLRRPFPNYSICEINNLLYFSHFFLSPVFFFFILESLVHPLPIFKVSTKKVDVEKFGVYMGPVRPIFPER